MKRGQANQVSTVSFAGVEDDPRDMMIQKQRVTNFDTCRRVEQQQAEYSCAARAMQDECESQRAWAVTYRLHYEDIGVLLRYLFQSETAIGESESCRAATNRPMFS